MILTEIRQYRIDANGERELIFSQDVFNEENSVALPFAQWPMWAKAMKVLSTKEDKGIGDVVRRVIGEENSDRFKKWFRKTFNRDCGCDGRLSEWNQKYPLDSAGE